jgi:RES domain-containing protein
LALPPDLPHASLSTVVFRVVQKGLDPLGTAGSLKAGGRFNPPNAFGALYTSVEVPTALKEVAKGLRLRGIDPEQFPEDAYWIYELEVRLEAVLDLTDPDVLQKSGFQEDSLTGTDINATREIATQARERGYEALLVPSGANPKSKNMVIFLDKLDTRPRVLSSRPVRLTKET